MKTIIVFICKFLYGKTKEPHLRRVLSLIIAKFEGGLLYSKTIRDVLKKYHNIDIGMYTYGSCFNPANVSSGVKIGRFCSIAPNVAMYTRNHPLDFISTHPFFYNKDLDFVEEDLVQNGCLEVGNDVWIGRNACILPGCKRIGDGAVIGAGAIVTHDVPDFAVVMGVPATVKRYRFDDATRAEIKNSKWWDENLEKISSNKAKFVAKYAE